jgi:hypothetical protein
MARMEEVASARPVTAVAPPPAAATAPSRPGPPPRSAPAARPPAQAAPAQWHRGLTVLAVISLFIGTRGTWTTAIEAQPAVAAVISACYAGILSAGVLAAVVRTRRALGRVDLGVLVLAATLVACGFLLHHDGTDEGVLTAQAAAELLRGHAVYGQPWPWVFAQHHVAVTKTMSGGGDYTYAYPPLTALLAAPLYALTHSTLAATLVTTLALLAGTVTLWVLLPAPWRSAATAVCLGFGLLPGYARAGYPALTALALLVPVVVRWPATGSGGRLGRGGAARAVCLGAACAAQQLAWFVLPFLVIGVHAVRRGELGPRRARSVTARYVGIAALTFLLVNAYVIAQGPGAWLSGSLLPFTQGGILHGQGLMGISYYFTDGSARLSFYTYGSVLLLLGLLAATALFPHRLGPGLTVLPWCAFYLATRSQDGYYLLMTPLWLAAVATVPSSALATAWRPRLPRVTGRRAKAAVAAALLAPAAVCAGVAAASPPPLRMTVERLALAHRPRPGITTVVVRAANATGTAVAPHFATRTGQGASTWWTVRSGPAVLRPHARATYVLRAPGGFHALPAGPGARPRTVLIAVSDSPMTITTAPLPIPPTTA